MEKNVFAACHLLRFLIYVAINRKKNLEKKNQLNAAVSSMPIANNHFAIQMLRFKISPQQIIQSNASVASTPAPINLLATQMLRFLVKPQHMTCFFLSKSRQQHYTTKPRNFFTLLAYYCIVLLPKLPYYCVLQTT